MSSNKPIVWTGSGAGAGIVESAVPKITPGNDHVLVWDLKIVVAIKKADAPELEKVFPSTGDYIARAVDGAGDSVDLKIRPAIKAGKVTITLADTEEVVLDGAPCEIKWGHLRITTKVQMQGLQIRVSDVSRHLALAGSLLGKAVGVAMVIDQTELFDNPAGPQVDQLVSYVRDGQTSFGRVTSIDEDAGDMVVADFDEATTIFDTEVVTVLNVQSEGATPVKKLVRNYAAAAKVGGAIPTWGDIIEAAAIVAGEGKVAGATPTTMYINERVVNVAAERSLPAEA